MNRVLLLTALHALVGNSLASTDCFTQHSASLSKLSTCGNTNTINICLSQIETYAEKEITPCFVNAGCTSDEAKHEAQVAVQRCLSLYAMHQEIKKRATSTDDSSEATTTAEESSKETSEAESTTEESSSEESTTETTATEATSTAASTTDDVSTTDSASSQSSTTSSSASSTVASTTASSGSSNSMSGTACFTTHTKQTEICDLITMGGVTETATCTQGESLSSECADNRVCTTDSSGGDICMERQGIQTGGIVIASVFGAASIIFFGGLFFACFKGSQKQKAAYAPLKS